jgi:hypothetical protein
MWNLTLFGKEVPTAVLGVVLVIAGVGATAGAAVSGDVVGDGTADVEQSILLNDSDAVTVNGDGIATASDDLTTFTYSAELFQGDTEDVTVDLQNRAGEALPARLVIDAEDPLSISVTDTNRNVEASRVSPNEFLLNVSSTAGIDRPNVLKLTIHAPNDVDPGFFDTEFQLEPVDLGDEVRGN